MRLRMLWFVSWYLIKDILKTSCVLRQVSRNVPKLDTNTHKEHCGKKDIRMHHCKAAVVLQLSIVTICF